MIDRGGWMHEHDLARPPGRDHPPHDRPDGDAARGPFPTQCIYGPSDSGETKRIHDRDRVVIVIAEREPEPRPLDTDDLVDLALGTEHLLPHREIGNSREVFMVQG